MKQYKFAIILMFGLSSHSLYSEEKVSKSSYIETIIEMSQPEELCKAFVEKGFVEEKTCVSKLSKIDPKCKKLVSDMFPGDMVGDRSTEMLSQILLCRVSLLKGLDFPAKDK